MGAVRQRCERKPHGLGHAVAPRRRQPSLEETEGVLPRFPEPALEGRRFGLRRDEAIPEERHSSFEAAVGQDLERQTPDDQLATLAVDVAQYRLRRNDALETTGSDCHGCLMKKHEPWSIDNRELSMLIVSSI